MEEKKLAIIATKGSLDWAYPPFILASTAPALGYETQIFFTFYGLQLLKRQLRLEVTPLGNGERMVSVDMTLTAPGCGMGDVLVEDAREKIAIIPTVSGVQVELVFDPPWNIGMMSDEARLQTGMM